MTNRRKGLRRAIGNNESEIRLHIERPVRTVLPTWLTVMCAISSYARVSWYLFCIQRRIDNTYCYEMVQEEACMSFPQSPTKTNHDQSQARNLTKGNKMYTLGRQYQFRRRNLGKISPYASVRYRCSTYIPWTTEVFKESAACNNDAAESRNFP